MESELLIICCGNLYSSDDAVGLHVAWRLKNMKLPKGVQLIEAGTPGLNLLDLWEGVQQVIIVDAVMSGSAPGTIHLFDGASLPPRDFLPLCLHGFNVIDAIDLARSMGRLPAELRILGIEILTEEAYYKGLSEQVAAAVEPACERVLEEAAKMTSHGDGHPGRSIPE
ncbi:MAG TPA: hydrogenase maturation protease [Syntrophomonadaceae bacterium]|nr:hydrogenase maturation protease [Syntrophomonadaceae bacterium]